MWRAAPPAVVPAAASTAAAVAAAVSTAAAGSAAATNAGGTVGNQNDGVINYMIVYLADHGVVESYSLDDGMARAGGFVGYAKASMNHSVTFLYGTITAKDHLGGTAVRRGIWTAASH